MAEVIDFWGGKQGYLSGVRSMEEQARLFDTIRGRPVAAPGCSQHQYGFAVDVFWLPIFSFKFNIQMTAKQTADFMRTLGESLGLKTVANDLGHFQIFAGSQFKQWAVASGFCVPREPKPQSLSEVVCGIGSAGFSSDRFGIHCIPLAFNEESFN